MLHAGLDLSRNRVDVCVLRDAGELVDEFSSPADVDGLIHLHRRVSRHGRDVRCVVESMTGARLVHDTLEALGFDVLIADAQKTKGLAPLACKTDRIDARVLAVLSSAAWCPRSGCPTRVFVTSASWPASGLTSSSTARC
jgi:transposase